MGSDWPHISYSDRDTGELLSLLERWAPSQGVRQQILVENPSRLFGSPDEKTWALLGVSFALVMIDGYDLFIVSFVAPLIAKDLHLNFMNIGSVFRSWPWQALWSGGSFSVTSRPCGRRPALIVSPDHSRSRDTALLAGPFTRRFRCLRFLTGLALGGLLAAIVPLVAEHFHRKSAVPQ